MHGLGWVHIWAVIGSAIAMTMVFAGASKISRPSRFESVLRQHSWMPLGWTSVLTRLIPTLELSLGAMVLLGIAVPLPMLGLLFLLVLFTTAMGVSVFRGVSELECGCLGRPAADRVDRRFFVRNCLLIAAAASSVVFGDRAIRLVGATSWTSFLEAAVVEAMALVLVILVLNWEALRALIAIPSTLKRGGDQT